MFALRQGLFTTPLLVALPLMFIAGCADSHGKPAPTEPTVRFKTSGPSLSVSSANPASAFQGTTNLDVQINGSGFDNGSKAGWSLHGVPYGKILVNSTSFVSSTQLVANISIATDAAIDNYDVAVTASTQKQGIGSDLFAITLATAIPVVGQSINDAGQVVGQAGSNGSSGALWDPQIGLVTIQKGSTLYAIDQQGSIISGQDGQGHAALWTSAHGAGGPWVESALPSLGSPQSAARSLAADAQGQVVILAGNVTTSRHNPAVWTRTGTGWQLVLFPLPPGVLGGWIQGINAKGMGAGMDGSTCCNALYWDSIGTPTRLPPVVAGAQAAAYSISGDGTVIVGNSNGIAVMWTRTLASGVYGAWGQPTPLETTSQYCSGNSAAYAVNTAGTIAVGVSCSQAIAWFIGPNSAAVRFSLGGLGPPNTGVAFAINNLVNPNAAGRVNSSGAYWKSF